MVHFHFVDDQHGQKRAVHDDKGVCVCVCVACCRALKILISNYFFFAGTWVGSKPMRMSSV